LKYKVFLVSTDYDDSADVFYGTVLNARKIMSFRGVAAEDLKASFHDVVDTHLEDCERERIGPEKPLSGKVTVGSRRRCTAV
jgi:predicted HicB family RNase H-like nuclease